MGIGVFLTGTDTGVGKTIIAGAIAQWFARQGKTVGVFKPIATGCVHRREGLVSEDSEMLAHCADTRHPLDVVCPQRYAEPLAPLVAAERAGQPVDWETVQNALNRMAGDADVMIVEGVGGVMVPLDTQHTVIDLIGWIGLPAIIVTRPNLGTINHTLLTTAALRRARIPIAGLIINFYPQDQLTIAEETNPRMLEKLSKVPLLAMVPNEPFFTPHLPETIQQAIGSVNWLDVASM